MKIAIVYSGQHRTYPDFPHWRENHINGLPEADVYYTAWDDEWAKDAGDDVVKFPIPNIGHNPYMTSYFDYMFKGKSGTNAGKQLTSTYSTLGHWLAMMWLPAKYDVIIRMRYDAILDDWGSHKDIFYDFCKRCYEEDVTFSFGNHKYSEDRDWRIHRKIPKLCRPIINHRLNDFLNIHRMGSMADPFDLSQKRRLLPHNEGWHQVLGDPAGLMAENYVGGVHIWRKISGKGDYSDLQTRCEAVAKPEER